MRNELTEDQKQKIDQYIQKCLDIGTNPRLNSNNIACKLSLTKSYVDSYLNQRYRNG